MTAPAPYRLATARQPGDRADGPPWVVLHGAGHQLDELLAFVSRLGHGSEFIVPVGCWGTYVGAMDLSSYSWFHEVPGVPDPEPVSFGRSLIDVEQLILTARSEADSPSVVLIGDGQGATLALTLAAVLPDRLTALIAVGGRPVPLPDGAVSGVPAAERPPAIWLAAAAERTAAEADGTLEELGSRTALTVEPMPEGGLVDDAAGERITAWIGQATELSHRA